MRKAHQSTRFAVALLLSLVGHLPSCLYGCCQAEESLPPQVVQLLNQCERLEKQKFYKLAITYLTRAIQLSPKTAHIYSHRGALRNAVGEYEPALQDFNKALALDDKRVEAYFGRAFAYDQLDKFALAVKDYEKYRTFPQAQQRDYAGCCLADNLGQLGETQQAIKILNEVIEHNPKNALARRQRGTFLNSDLGNPKQAVIDFTIAIEEKDNEYRDIYALRAGAYKRLKDYPKAVADYSMVLKLSPNDDNAYRQRAAVYEQLGDYKKAIADYSAGIDRNPEWGGPNYFARARCYKKLGQNVLAQKDLEACKRLNYDGK